MVPGHPDPAQKMTWKRTLLRACGRMIPDVYHPPGGVLFPYAHIVSDMAPLHVRHLYSVPNIAKFKEDIDFLRRRFRPLRLSELSELPGSRDNRAAHSFILSFDDGMREIYDTIAPALREKGLPAIFFINTATIDNRRLMWRHKVSLLIDRSKQQPGRIPPQISSRPGHSFQAKLNTLRFAEEPILDEIASFFGLDFVDYLQSHRPYLTTDQVLELSGEGFELGSHSESHPYFNEMAVEDQRKQISESVTFLRKLGLSCRYFAFPFHDTGVPTSVFTYMADLHLVLSLGTSEARVDSIPFSFQRFAFDAENSNLRFEDVLRQLSAKSLVRRLSRSETIRRS
jgi:peptidoglycan/xylan/chitin deacetylase (PgdA/CDA1 family)